MRPSYKLPLALLLMAVLFMLPTSAWSQANPVSVTLTAYAPPGVSSFTGAIVGTSGNASACYYVVTNYVGGAIISPPFCSQIVPNTLSGTNYVKLTWTAPNPTPDVRITYDVLKTAYGTAPAPGAATSLTTASSALTYNDQGGGLSAYTMRGFPYLNASANVRLNNWDFPIPQVELQPIGSGAWFTQGGDTSGNATLEAQGPGTNVGIGLVGKGTGALQWDGVTLADSSGGTPDVVYSVNGSLTVAQVNAGTTVLAANALRTLDVVHVLLQAKGGAVGTCTSVNVSDTTGTPVDVATVAAAALTEDTIVTEYTPTTVTLGTFAAPLTAGKGLQVRAVGGACDTATSFTYVVLYKINS